MTAQKGIHDDIARFEYRMVPSAGDISWGNYAIALTPRIAFPKNNVLGGQFLYEKTMFSFFDTTVGLPIDSFEEIHQIAAGVFYRSNFSNAWGMKVFFSPVISSNLSQSLSWDDVQYAGSIAFLKKWIGEKNDIGFRFGLGYGALFGEPDFYPILSVGGTLGNHMGYRLGFPETHVYRNIGERHQVNLSVAPEGSFTNLSGALNDNGLPNLNDAKLEYKALDIGLEHTFRIQPYLNTLVKVGYLTENSLQLLDEATVMLNDFDTNGSVYITMGLTVNLNKYVHENND